MGGGGVDFSSLDNPLGTVTPAYVFFSGSEDLSLSIDCSDELVSPPSKSIPNTLTLIAVEDAYSCFAKLLEFYDQMRK